jgi:SAM-dependent methyltransferase
MEEFKSNKNLCSNKIPQHLGLGTLYNSEPYFFLLYTFEVEDQIKQRLIDSFSSEASIKKYQNDVEKGLWASEEILIQQFFPAESSVLDLGCGAGRTTLPLHEMGYVVTGVDITPKFIDLAKTRASEKNFQIDFRVGDACSLDFPDNSFDNVLFSFNGWSMIPTKESRLEAAKEIYRVLKPNGHYIFTAHKRTFFGQELIWITQFIRLYLLKPLGYKTLEKDFGDYYFTRDSETSYPISQFVSFMDVNEVKKLHEGLVFKTKLMKMRSEITKDDNSLTSGDVMFFVFQK